MSFHTGTFAETGKPSSMGALQLTPLGLLFWMRMVYLTSAQNGAELTVAPDNITAVVGETTVLQCTWREPRGWFLVGRGSVEFMNENGTFPCSARRTCSESLGLGKITATLTISSVLPEDAGGYLCNYESPGGELLRSPPVYITVIAPPNDTSPQCLMRHPVPHHLVGTDVLFTCYSRGGIPPAQLYWYRGPKLVAGPSAGSLTYTHRVTESDDGLILTCRLRSEVLLGLRNCSVVVDIPPEAEIQPRLLTIRSGANVSFTCRGRYFPESYRLYTWTLPNASQNLQFDYQIQDGVLNLFNLQTILYKEIFNLTCLVSDGSNEYALDTVTLQILMKGTDPPGLPSTNSSNLSMIVVVVCSCVLVLVIVVTSLFLLRMKIKRQLRPDPVAACQALDDHHQQQTDYTALSARVGPNRPHQMSAYQGLVPESMDLTFPPDPDWRGTRPDSGTVYEVTDYPVEVKSGGNEYEKAVVMPVLKKGSELYVNHDVVKGKRHRGGRK
ncbi:poliovirus receptor homolog [Acanthaster planci]|uniref:Poliovirus receptor homolog n=1 Tax=Acanthaster planci TaxID=133434 RepID=A0A8B7ZM20_ACAPL|nr:poliovirus receptor homolog [Acanthaster planci]